MKSDEHFCKQCGKEHEHKLNNGLCEDVIFCLTLALQRSQSENQLLKKRIEVWKNGWYEGREILGKLWLHHPAIDNEEERTKYRQLRRNNQVVNEMIAMLAPEWKVYAEQLTLCAESEYQQYLKLRRKFHDY